MFDGLSIGTGDNDTRKIKEWLEAGESVDEVLSGIEGPYVPLRSPYHPVDEDCRFAFIYFHVFTFLDCRGQRLMESSSLPRHCPSESTPYPAAPFSFTSQKLP